jgi:hypothetical protein
MFNPGTVMEMRQETPKLKEIVLKEWGAIGFEEFIAELLIGCLGKRQFQISRKRPLCTAGSMPY